MITITSCDHKLHHVITSCYHNNYIMWSQQLHHVIITISSCDHNNYIAWSQQLHHVIKAITLFRAQTYNCIINNINFWCVVKLFNRIHSYKMAYKACKTQPFNILFHNTELTITAGHRTFSETLHEFLASCSSDRTTCPLIHTASPH